LELSKLTLILSAITRDFAFMASDRRLSSARGVITDDSGKAGVIYADDGFALYAYTGLAQLGRFNARQWIQQALMDASDGSLNRTLYSFAEIAERKFANLAYRGQGVTLALAGFSDSAGPLMGTVSNLEDSMGSVMPIPGETFRTQIRINPDSNTHEMSGVMVNGINQTQYKTELRALNELILADCPPVALEQKATHLIRQLADDPRTGGTVGKNLMVATLPRPEAKHFFMPIATYMPFEETSQVHFLDVLDLRSTGGPKLAFRDIQLIHDDRKVQPRLGRNERCHCGSGRKFKYCHGR
jgi:hypothetical protein